MADKEPTRFTAEEVAAVEPPAPEVDLDIVRRTMDLSKPSAELDAVGATIGREIGRLAKELQPAVRAFGRSVVEAHATFGAFEAAQLGLEEVLAPPEIRQVRIPWTSLSADLDLLAYGVLAVAALLYGGM